MSHKLIKDKSFLAGKGIPKIGECHATSFFFYFMLAPKDREQFKRYFLIYLRPLSSVPKSIGEKSPAHAKRLGEYICRHCEILAMQ